MYLSTEQYYSFPANKFTPNIANIMKMHKTTIPTLNIAPVDDNSAITTVFIDEL